jgi:hypothetical protein
MKTEKSPGTGSEPSKPGVVSSETHDPAEHKAPNVRTPNIGRETDPTWSPQNPADVKGDRGRDK